MVPQDPINEHIRVPEVRVIGDAGEQIGVLPTTRALELARERELDLVLVAPNAQPPVARILDYGKYAYQKEKELKKQRAQNKGGDVKTVKLSVRIGKNDFDIRVQQAKKFLDNGDKVKVELQLRGREKQHPDVAHKIVSDFLATVGTLRPFKTEQPVKKMGGTFSALITP